MVRMRTLALVVAVSFTSAANAQPRTCVEPDRALTHFIFPDPRTSPKLSEVDALERRLKTAPPNSMAAVLLQLGRMKSQLVVDEAYAKARPDEFQRNEFNGGWAYTGWHFSELIKRYPRHRHVDKAAYALTFIPEPGECEGYVPCQVASLWGRIEPFLRTHQHSELADSAVQRALLAFSAIKPNMDLVRGNADVDPPEIRKLVESLESVANSLPVARRAVLLTRVAELKEQMGDLRAARTDFRTAASLAGAGKLGDCASRQVMRLEERLARP